MARKRRREPFPKCKYCGATFANCNGADEMAPAGCPVAQTRNGDIGDYASDRVVDGARPLSKNQVVKLKANYLRTCPGTPGDIILGFALGVIGTLGAIAISRLVEMSAAPVGYLGGPYG